MKNTTKMNLLAVAVASMLSACGGGGDDAQTTTETSNPNSNSNTPTAAFYPMEVEASTYGVDKKEAYLLLNNWRTSCGFNSVSQNTNLDKAAQAHADYLINLVPSTSHFEVVGNPGFTGVNAMDRAQAAAYDATRTTEVIAGGLSGTYFSGATPVEIPENLVSAQQHVKRLFASVYHMDGALNELTNVGIGYATSTDRSVDPTKTNFFTVASLTLANETNQKIVKEDHVETYRSFPCDNVTGVLPLFYPEEPNPFVSYDLAASPKGHPILIQSPSGTTADVTNFELLEAGTTPVSTTKVTDPHGQLTPNKVFFVPDTMLKDNTTYLVKYDIPAASGTETKTFSFVTATQN